MGGEKALAREEFEAMVRECMMILEKYGLTPQISRVPQTDTRFEDAFEDWCFGWFGDVEKGVDLRNDAKPQKVVTGLDWRNLDEITLECALAFIGHGVHDVHYNESLNAIRGAIRGVIEVMGYEGIVCPSISQPIWGCYKLWEEVGRYSELSEKEISDRREWFRENRKEYYEE